MELSKYVERGDWKIEIPTTTITTETYHDFDAISRSTLEWLIPSAGGSVEKYKYMKLTADLALDEETSKYMRIGTALHKYAENPLLFKAKSINMPGPGLKRFIDLLPDTITPLNISKMESAVHDISQQAGYGLAWSVATRIKKVMEDGLEYWNSLADKDPHVMYLSPEEHYVVSQAMSSMAQQECIVDPSKIYGPAWELQTEVPAVVTINGKLYKILMDRFLINHEDKKFRIQDLKTTTSSIPNYTGYSRMIVKDGIIDNQEVIGKMYDNGVHRQLEFYKFVASQFYPGYKFDGADVLVQQTVAPYEFHVEPVSENWMMIGSFEMASAIKIVDSLEDIEKYAD